jgi:hypothetical protein
LEHDLFGKPASTLFSIMFQGFAVPGFRNAAVRAVAVSSAAAMIG